MTTTTMTTTTTHMHTRTHTCFVCRSSAPSGNWLNEWSKHTHTHTHAASTHTHSHTHGILLHVDSYFTFMCRLYDSAMCSCSSSLSISPCPYLVLSFSRATIRSFSNWVIWFFLQLTVFLVGMKNHSVFLCRDSVRCGFSVGKQFSCALRLNRYFVHIAYKAPTIAVL